jgi:hypothetical protein
MPTEISAVKDTQSINPAAVVDAAMRAVYAAYQPGGLDFVDFAEAIRKNPEANSQLEELLETLGVEAEDGLNGFAIGMFAGAIYAASTGLTLKVPPFAELKASLEAQEAKWKGMRAAPDAPQVA